MQDFDHKFPGVLPRTPAAWGGHPLPHLSRPSPCFLTPNIFDAPPPPLDDRGSVACDDVILSTPLRTSTIVRSSGLRLSSDSGVVCRPLFTCRRTNPITERDECPGTTFGVLRSLDPFNWLVLPRQIAPPPRGYIQDHVTSFNFGK